MPIFVYTSAKFIRSGSSFFIVFGLLLLFIALPIDVIASKQNLSCANISVAIPEVRCEADIENCIAGYNNTEHKDLYQNAMTLIAVDFPEVVHKAESGDVVLQLVLGYRHFYGIKTRPDPSEAFKWFKKAAITGNPIGMFYLGRMYCFGEGVTEDRQEALKWYCKAKEKGIVVPLLCN